MEILSKDTRKILAEKQVTKAIHCLLGDENLKEIDVILSNGKTITVKRLFI
ncbi:MAG: hypothetical protein Q8Q89_03870 [bacterium]|nr:hypothetical protein [bacterium]